MSDQESVIEGISFNGLDNIKIHADFLTNGSATPDSEGINGTFEKNINGDGKLSLNWRSSEGGGLSAGQVVTVRHNGHEYSYFLEENYTPSPNGDGTYTWSPTFVDTDSNLKGVIVYKQINVYRNDVNNIHNPTLKSVKIYTFPMTGTASMLVGLLNTIASEAEVGEVVLGDDYKNTEIGRVFVSVSFDQDNLVSAAEKIASALGTNSTIENGHICIGTHDGQLAVSEHFDRFVILGGTRNMGKRVMEGDDTYAAVTLRLTLDEEKFPDSVLPANTPPKEHMTKVLIFDDIYPKIKLKVKGVRERICYLYDDEGKIFIKDGQAQTYSKFYVTLDYYHEAEEDSGEESGYKKFAFDVKTVIEGRTLGIVFQSGLLTGREFDLAYYDDDDDTEYDSHEDKEWIDWPDGPDGEEQHHSGNQDTWIAEGGEFRICIVADGDTLLPNTTLRPQVGDFVTLTGVVIDDEYERIAQQELLKAAEPYVELYMSTKATEGQVPVSSSENEYVVDFLTGETVNVSPGDSCDETGDTAVDGDYVITSVTTDIKTGKQSVRFGTFEPQSKMSSMANKLETASVSAGAALVGQGNDDDYIRHTAAMSLDQFKTLYEVYGHLGMKKVNKRVDDAETDIQDLFTDMEAIGQQADRKIDLWFRKGEPLPNIYKPNDTANLPASNWTEEEKPGHDQDLYYDNSRLVLGSTDCRVWRWEEVELTTNGTTTKKWLWNEVTDAQTIAALELIAEVASDGILSAGAEKSRVLVEWRAAAADHADLATRVKSFNASAWQAYDAAYQALCDMLNNGATYSSGTPSWLDEDHILTNTTIDDPDDYRDVWNEYYEALAALTGEITAKKCSVFVSDSDEPPTPPYNPGDMWIQPDQGNKVLYCVTGKTSSEQYNATDWQDMSAQPDARSLLIALAEEVYASGVFPGNVSAVTVQLAAGGQSSLSPAPSQTSSSLSAALAGCYDAFGAEDIVITLGSTPQSGNETFDLALIPITFQDPVLQNNVNGGFDILMYNAKNHWEMISKSTTALIENLGSAIRLLVFGSANGSMSDVITGSGIVTQEDFTKIFAEAQMWDANANNQQGGYVTIAEALFGIEVEPVRNGSNQILYFDDNGNSYTQPGTGRKPHYVSSAQLSADKINFKTGTFKIQTTVNGSAVDVFTVSNNGVIAACVNYFSLNDINGNSIFSVDANNNVTLNANVLKIKANEVIWKPVQQSGTTTYMDVIPGSGSGGGGSYSIPTDSKFAVDDNGNVYMNDAHVNGTIYANAGRIGGTNGWTIDTDKIYKDTIGSNGSMFLSTTNLAGTVAGHIINAADLQTEGWRFSVGSKFGVTNNGTLYANNAVLNGDFTTAGGKIQLAETQKTGYKWYGMAYTGNPSDALAIGMRDYTSSFGGHLAMQGGGSTGGIFDVLVGGDKTQSVIRMGQGTAKMGIEIDGYGAADKSGRVVRIGDYTMASDGTLTGSDYVKMFTTTVGSTTTGHIDATGSLTIGMNASNQKRSVISDTEVAFPAIFISVAANTTVNLPNPPKQGQLIIVKGYGSGARLNPSAYGVMNGSDNASALNSDGYFYVEDQTILLCFDYYTGNGGAWHQIYSA